MKFKSFIKENLITICTILFIFIFLGSIMITQIYQNNNLYKAMVVDVENKNWLDAKTKLDTLNANKMKDCNDYNNIIYYNYYLDLGETSLKKKEYHKALNEYQKAFNYNSKDKSIKLKIKELEATCKKLDEIERQKAEQERKKAEQEEKLKTQRMLNNVVILSQYFGYTQYGEYGVVGKIKNNNSFPVQVRADIDLKDYRGNVIDATYTYDSIAPNSVWNFEAPIFGNIAPHHSYIHLTIERLD